MEKFKGILQIRHCNQGSHSEGNFAFLVADDGSEIGLCREGGYPFNDPYYEPYADLYVEITGTVSHGALIVESIEESEPTPEQEEAEKQEQKEQEQPTEQVEE